MGDNQELANGYTHVNETQFSAAQFLLQKLDIRAGAHVLDVGCGPGNLTLHIANIVGMHGSVVGVDPSKERIAIARQAPAHNVSYFEGIAEDLSRFDSHSFDYVFLNSTLHWVQDQPKALQEFSRVLKPGGQVGISGGSGDYIAAHETIKEKVLAMHPYRDYPEKGGPKFLKKSQLETLLTSAGFDSMEIVTNVIVKWAKDADSMITWLDTSSSGQTYGSIPVTLRSSAREEMKKEWNKMTTVDGINMKMELLVTVASKE